ncbi:MAG TPA: LuxR C-terminal-related transcriptional regulator [Acidimicrobiales bacterium]|nr:LuxR C-terminal-related transcriptional regulator [Acidimicrobiales bacterium]
MGRSIPGDIERGKRTKGDGPVRHRAATGSDKATSRQFPERAPVVAAQLERCTCVSDPDYRIIACVDVRPVGEAGAGSLRSDLLWELAVRRIERCIRPGDWICMLGGNRFAVSFGNGGHRVPPGVLGSRLARAMGDHLAVGHDALEFQVSVGIGASYKDLDPTELTDVALAATRSASGRLAANPHGPHAMVSVTHVPRTVVHFSGARHGSSNGCSRPPTRSRRLVRRVILTVGSPDGVQLANGSSDTSLDAMHHPSAQQFRVLVVDPGAPTNGQPRLGAEAVAAITRRVGGKATITPSSDSARVLLDLYMHEPHAAVIVLQDEFEHERDGRPWDVLAGLVRAMCSAAVPVIAVSIGASAAAVAACVEHGATGLLDAETLVPELFAMAARMSEESGNANGNHGDGQGAESTGRRFPAPFSALVELTPSERRVLSHMMEGRSAAEIAEALVVSLPTVRSHIRSILRKLNVNSQLAAVAIANGTLREVRVGA